MNISAIYKLEHKPNLRLLTKIQNSSMHCVLFNSFVTYIFYLSYDTPLRTYISFTLC